MGSEMCIRDRTGTLYTLTARLNGKPVSFILDLGASGTLINYPALRTLFTGIRINKTASQGSSAGSRLNDIHGDDRQARLVRLQWIGIGRQKWKKPQILAYNAEIFGELGVANKPFGLFGADLLAGRSFALDFQGGQFYVERGKR